MIGEKIKQYRKNKSMTLSHLGEKADVTASYLSQVERGIIEPSISTLRKIANVFGLPVYYFFLEESKDNFLITKAERKIATLRDNDLTTSFITPVNLDSDSLNMVAFETVIAPFSERGKIHESVHDAEEIILIQKGSLQIAIGEDVHELNIGDSIYIKANVKHTMKNISDEEVICLSCISPGIY